MLPTLPATASCTNLVQKNQFPELNWDMLKIPTQSYNNKDWCFKESMLRGVLIIVHLLLDIYTNLQCKYVELEPISCIVPSSKVGSRYLPIQHGTHTTHPYIIFKYPYNWISLHLFGFYMKMIPLSRVQTNVGRVSMFEHTSLSYKPSYFPPQMI